MMESNISLGKGGNMENFLKKSKSLGVIGEGSDVNHFVIKANALSYTTYQLCEKEAAKKVSEADECFIGSLSDKKEGDEFLRKSDLLVYFDRSIDLAELALIEKEINMPQGEDLLAIAQDRSFQKAFYESIGVNIAPYKMIVDKEDIKEALGSIGYPAVLRSNFIQEDESLASAFIYEEEDIEKASDLLKYGPALLESWIVAEDYLAISAVKTEDGSVDFYPIMKKHYKDGRLEKIVRFETDNQELVTEVKKAAQRIIDNISFTGLISLSFIVSPAEALYLGELSPYPSVLSRYSEGNPGYSSLDAHLRALLSLPVPKMDEKKLDFVYRPLYADQQETINDWLLNEPRGQFYFYPWTKKEAIRENDELGYFLIENTEDEKLED